MVVDATFEFEKRRNRPVKYVTSIKTSERTLRFPRTALFLFSPDLCVFCSRYDRELMGTTLRAMQRVAEIRTRREEMFYQRRMKDAHKAETKAMKVELKTNIELLAPAAADKEKVLLNVVAAAKAKTAAKKAKTASRVSASATSGDMSD